MKVYRIISHIIVLLTALSSCSAIGKQQPLEETAHPATLLPYQVDSLLFAGYPFLNVDADTLQDSTLRMKSVYDAMDRLLAAHPDSLPVKVNIIHYGDSHIQAGTLTNAVMKRMHAQFGNAGRGMVIPHKLMKSNEPRDYKILSSNNWIKAKINKSCPETTIGVAGVGIESSDNTQQFLIRTLLCEDSIDYSFNRVVVFHDSLAPMITVNEALLADVSGSDIYYPFTTEIDLCDYSDSLEMYTYRNLPFEQGAFYGFSLENGRSGILYHAMGVNGACYLHWGRRGEVAIESKALMPELIIISMGTNEASGRNFIESVFYREVDSFVSKLQAENPDAVIMLTTPIEAMRKTKRSAIPNKNYRKVRDVLAEYAHDKRLPLFDMYTAAGAENSSKFWDKASLVQRDKIHYTAQGYTLQGALIYNAILNGYKKYKSQHPPIQE